MIVVFIRCFLPLLSVRGLVAASPFLLRDASRESPPGGPERAPVVAPWSKVEALWIDALLSVLSFLVVRLSFLLRLPAPV